MQGDTSTRALLAVLLLQLISYATARVVPPSSLQDIVRGDGRPGTRETDRVRPPGFSGEAAAPPGIGNNVISPPGYEAKGQRAPPKPDSDPFGDVKPPGWQGKESYRPGYHGVGRPAEDFTELPDALKSKFAAHRGVESHARENHTPRNAQGPPIETERTRTSEGSSDKAPGQRQLPPNGPLGVPGPPSMNPDGSYRTPGPPAPGPGAPGTQVRERFAAPGTAKGSGHAPGFGSNPMVAQSYYHVNEKGPINADHHVTGQSYDHVMEKRPLGIREPDTNMTIDEIITKVMGGPHALRTSSMIGANGTILAELDMRLTVDQYLNLYQHKKEEEGHRFKRKALADVRLRWHKSIIPYEFVYSDFNEQEVAIIKASMDEWQEVTCLKFVQARPWHYNKIRFQDGEGCSSQVGMVGGAQAIYLDKAGCRWRGLFLHEVAHSIGLVHEHQLPDRDDHIYIHWDKVDPAMKEWFQKYDRSEINTYGVEYDLQSVMHYGITAFSTDGKTKTIKVLNSTMSEKVGLVRMKELSFSDMKIVNLMYECNAHCPSDIKCRGAGYVDKNCECVCKEGGHDCYESGEPVEEPDDDECEDSFPSNDCHHWADYGECYLNANWMAINCRKSCQKCPKHLNDTVDFGCDDTSPKCPEWEKAGECKKNHFWMLHHCPKSCGRCGQGDCKNTHGDDKMCEFWASSGECETNRGWMVEKCRKACDKCILKGACGNLHHNDSHCRLWAGQGECKANPNWMGDNCMKSCGLCQDSVRNTTSDTCINSEGDDQCVAWAAKGECTKNSDWMMANCRKSCTKCLFIDVNDKNECLNTFIDDDQCESWARSGECDRNPEWMRDLCKKSCKRCKKHVESDCINFYLDEEKCDDWVKSGQCLSNAVWMAANCNRSCTKCKEIRPCVNYFSDAHQCNDWAKVGECHANREWMIDNCYIACTDCDGGNRTRGRSCINRYHNDEKCDLWTDLGECKYNRDWMMSKCYRSCSECDGISRKNMFPCINKFKDESLCWSWAHHGQCDKNRIWMIKNCRAACKGCKDSPYTTPPPTTTTTTQQTTTRTSCVDTYYDKRMCRVWAAGKQCSLNPTWMVSNCRKSCDKCEAVATTTIEPDIWQPDGDYDGSGEVTTDPDCEDTHIQCRSWAEHGQCSSNPGYMYPYCKRACGMCNPVNCVDRNRLCGTWARTSGYCTVNARYMLPNCPKACGLCSS